MRKVTSARRQKLSQEQPNVKVELPNQSESLTNVDITLNDLGNRFDTLKNQFEQDRKNLLEQVKILIKEMGQETNSENTLTVRKDILQSIAVSEHNTQLKLTELEQQLVKKIENLGLSLGKVEKLTKNQHVLFLEKQEYIIDQIEKINASLSKLDNQPALDSISSKFITDIKEINNQLFDQIRTFVRTEVSSILEILLPQKKDIETERTISFQLGKELIGGAKSIENLFSLPKRLAALKKENEYRKELKQKVVKNITAQEVKNTKPVNTQQIEVKQPKPEVTTPKLEEKESLDLEEQYPLIAYGNIKKYWPEQAKKAKFISILDEISYNSWTNEFKLFPLNKNNNVSQIQGSSSSAFFIESCWKGNDGAWEYAFTSPGLKHKNAQKLLESLDAAKKRDLPIIFWNKEDPMHYEKFLPIAEKCDVIFTTDENKVNDYKKDLPGKKVYALLFAANPYICNPINRNRYEEETICFAGSYYSVGHDDRKDQMDALLPALLEFNGAIYDRMSKLNNERYFFPEQYRHLIRDAVDFKEMSVLYKHFKIFLNVNTITDSPTMMSRRVYELLACGTPVISTPSLALEKQFSGIVQIAKNAEEAVKIAKELLSDEWKYKHLSHKGYREVMLKHTYGHRVSEILSSINISYTKDTPKVSIIMATMREHFIDRIIENISRQNYVNFEVMIVTQNFSKKGITKLKKALSSLKKLKGFQLIEINSEMTLGERLNKAASLSKGEYLAKMDDDDFYFENYLTDMMIPFSFGNFGLVGKKEIFIYLEGMDKTVLKYYQQGHRVTDFVAGATLVINKSIFDSVGGFDALNRSEDSTLIEKLKGKNYSIYAADPFNFIAWRGKDTQNHTWQVNDEFFINSKLSQIYDGLDLEKVVI
ncbi:glycosyltransferase family protein [Acinetobacter higginsii]|uniref:glycosyltransferase family protein n=1 Tax=Acinetobacter higginsii TaxID=70347 RepID=UPI001F4A3FB1|nr:glycosyltransferase [Acinetobacter higginsii]MCH7340612.1 glycosyltransferase [Acinetobacter higginsii]